MKVFKVELMVLDFYGIGAKAIKGELENANFGNDCIHPTVKSCEGRDIGNWINEHPLNNSKTRDAEYHRLFELNKKQQEVD